MPWGVQSSPSISFWYKETCSFVLQCTYSTTMSSQAQHHEYSLPVSKYEYPHWGASLTALLPGIAKHLSSQQQLTKTAATRFPFFSSERRTYFRTSYHSLYNKVWRHLGTSLSEQVDQSQDYSAKRCVEWDHDKCLLFTLSPLWIV